MKQGQKFLSIGEDNMKKISISRIILNKMFKV